MHRFSLLSPKVSENRRPLSVPLVRRFPNPVWLRESLIVSLCRSTKDRLVLWSHLIPESSLQHFLIPSVFFFFFYESYYCKPLIESWGFSLLPARMYLTFLFCRVCRSEFGSLLWSDEVKSPTRLAPSLAGEFHREGNVSFGISNSPCHFRNEEAFLFLSLQKNWIFSNFSCINLASFKISILNKRTVSP